MNRLDGWADRLLEVVELHRAAPFVWGRTDCAMLFRHCAQVCTGVDPLADLSPWYSRASAARALLRAGHRTAIDLVAARFVEIHPAQAQRGDVGFCEIRDDLSAPAIILGAEAVSRDESRFLVFPAGLLVRTFRI